MAEAPIDDALKAKAAEWRQHLIEQVSEMDEEVMEMVLDDKVRLLLSPIHQWCWGIPSQHLIQKHLRGRAK